MGQSVLELSVALGLGIPTYRLTDMCKAICPPFSKRGINIWCHVWSAYFCNGKRVFTIHKIFTWQVFFYFLNASKECTSIPYLSSNYSCLTQRTISGCNAFSPTFYFVPVQTIVSPYDAKCVTPLIYSTTDWDNCFVWLKFVFFIFLKPVHNLFCKRHYPIIVNTITRHVLQVNVHVCIF